MRLKLFLLLSSILSWLICTNLNAQAVSTFPEEVTPAGADLLYLIKSPGGAGTSRKTQVINITKGLAPASATIQGVVTTAAQTFAGAKTFNNPIGIGVSSGSSLLKLGNDSLDSMNWGTSTTVHGEISWSSGAAIVKATGGMVLHLGANNSNRVTIDTNGLIGFNKSSSIGAHLHQVVINAGDIGHIIELAATPTANAFEINTFGGSGGDLCKVGPTGLVTSASDFYSGMTSGFGITSRFYSRSPSDGSLTLSNWAGSDFGRLQLGGTSAAFPSIKRNSTAINFRLADDSADAPVTTGNLSVGGSITSTQSTLEGTVSSLVSTATNDDPSVVITQNRIVTVDATVSTIRTIPITASRTYRIHAEIVARRTGGVAGTTDDGALYTREWAFTTKAGTVTQLGSDAPLFTAEDQVGWDFDAAVSGANVVLQVVGAVDNDVVWHLSKCEISSVGT